MSDELSPPPPTAGPSGTQKQPRSPTFSHNSDAEGETDALLGGGGGGAAAVNVPAVSVEGLEDIANADETEGNPEYTNTNPT